MGDVSPMAVYAGFCVLVALGFGVGWVILQLANAVRVVRRLISEEPDPVDAQLDTNPVEPLLTHVMRDDEETDDTAADFVLWANELDQPGIRKYSRRMDRRSL